MLYSFDTLITCICCAFAGAAVPLIIFEVLADLKDRREKKEDEFFYNGEWHRRK